MPVFENEKLQSTTTSTPAVHTPNSRAPARQQPAYGATVAVPIKQNKIEPWNPYPPRAQNPKTMTTETALLYAAVVTLLVAASLLISTIFVQKFAEREIAKSIHKLTAPYAEIATLEFGGVTVSLFHPSVTIRNLQINLPANESHGDETITIRSAKVWGLDWATLKQIATNQKFVIPQTAKFALNDVHVDDTFFGSQAALQAMGYNGITFSTSADIARTQSSFDLKNLFLDAKKMGRFNASISLGHLAMPTPSEIARIKKTPRLLLAETGAFTKATIRGFTLNFEDKTITRRVANYFERLGETSPLTLTKIALELNLGARNPAEVDFVKPALQTLSHFFETPTTLSLRAEPAREVPILSLIDDTTGESINDLAHKLNLTLQ